MKTVREHIAHVQGKPHHIRKQVALTLAAGGATFIGLVWFMSSWYLGAFAIPSTSFADRAVEPTVAARTAAPSNEQFAGAAAALQSADEPAHIEIVDAPSASAKKPPEQTTIPF